MSPTGIRSLKQLALSTLVCIAAAPQVFAYDKAVEKKKNEEMMKASFAQMKQQCGCVFPVSVEWETYKPDQMLQISGAVQGFANLGNYLCKTPDDAKAFCKYREQKGYQGRVVPMETHDLGDKGWKIDGKNLYCGSAQTSVCSYEPFLYVAFTPLIVDVKLTEYKKELLEDLQKANVDGERLCGCKFPVEVDWQSLRNVALQSTKYPEVAIKTDMYENVKNAHWGIQAFDQVIQKSCATPDGKAHFCNVTRGKRGMMQAGEVKNSESLFRLEENTIYCKVAGGTGYCDSGSLKRDIFDKF
jgi:hypothetical protein